MITTWPRVQSVLGLDAGMDTLVETLIPLVEEDYLRIRNKPFDVGKTLTVTNGATADGNITLTIFGVDALVEVAAGDDPVAVAIKIKAVVGTDFRGVFPIIFIDPQPRFFDVTRIDATLQFVSKREFEDITIEFTDTDTTGVTIGISPTTTIYPPGAEFTAIKMIQFQLTAAKAAGIISESLGDHSISYEAGLMDYPKSVISSIKRYVGWS